MYRTGKCYSGKLLFTHSFSIGTRRFIMTVMPPVSLALVNISTSNLSKFRYSTISIPTGTIVRTRVLKIAYPYKNLKILAHFQHFYGIQ